MRNPGARAPVTVRLIETTPAPAGTAISRVEAKAISTGRVSTRRVAAATGASRCDAPGPHQPETSMTTAVVLETYTHSRPSALSFTAARFVTVWPGP